MSTRGDNCLQSAGDQPKRARRLQTGVRTLIVLVACCGLILWTVRRVQENSDPVLAEARAIQKRAIGMLRAGKPADRMDAVHELVRLNAGERAVAIPPLIGALEDPETEVRIAAAEALGSFGHVAMSRSQSGKETVGDVATALIRCLNDPQPGVRAAAATSLATPLELIASRIDRQAVMDALASALGDRDARVRLAAIRVLVSPSLRTGPPKALLTALDDESAENRVEAIRSLRRSGQGLVFWVPALLRVASKERDPSVQDLILTIWDNELKRLKSADVVPVLIASLQSGDRKVRGLAAILLAHYRASAKADIPELLRVLNEPLEPDAATTSNGTRISDPANEAALVLGRIAPGSAEAKKVLAALIEVARSGPRSRRAWAASSLGGFGTDAAEAAPVLTHLIEQSVGDPNEDLTLELAQALANIAPHAPSARQAIPALLGLLESKETGIRFRVLWTLESFGPSAAAAIPKIRTLKNDRELQIREAAERALLAIENSTTP